MEQDLRNSASGNIYDSCVRACQVASVMSDCGSMDCGLPGSTVHEILQAGTPEWLPGPPPGGLPDPGIEPRLLRLLHWQAGSLPLVPLESPYNRYKHTHEKGIHTQHQR